MERKTVVVLWINAKTGMIRSPDPEGGRDYAFSAAKYPHVKKNWAVSFLAHYDSAQNH